MLNLEREIFKCPIIETQDKVEKYPEPSDEQILLMSLRCDYDKSDCYQVFGTLKRNFNDEEYIEILFYNDSLIETLGQCYKKFVIQKNYAMSLEDEIEFIECIRMNKLQIDMTDFVYFQEEIKDYCKEANIARGYDESEIGLFLEQIYYSLHRCGAKEILCKAGFGVISHYLFLVDGYNIIGHSPATILGMPIKLIALLDRLSLYDRFFAEDVREKEKEIYERFSDYINSETSLYQWRYLESLGATGENHVEKKIYKEMRKCKSDQAFYDFFMYLELSRDLGNLNPYPNLKKINEICAAVPTMKEMLFHKDNIDEENLRIQENNGGRYFFEDDVFITISPSTVQEIIEEAVNQDNCLTSYINSLVHGEVNILFIRRKEEKKQSYITVEIIDNVVIQAKGRFNDIPDRCGLEFLEKVVMKYGLSYDPESIIFEDMDYDILDDRPDLLEYLEEYEKRTSGVQMTLWDLFPEAM